MFPQTPYTKSIDFHGSLLTLQTGLLARQATASVLATIGETSVLATVVVGKPSDRDYFPLQVIYEERLYASGKIKGSRFMKREGRPSDDAVLTGRMVDRSLRSLFNNDLRNEVQVIITVLSVDEVNPPDVLAVLAASSACCMAGFGKEFKGPVSAVRVATQKMNLKERLINNLILDIKKAEHYTDFWDKVETICQVLDLKNESDKALFRKAYDLMREKDVSWVDELKKTYRESTRLSPAQIKAKTGIMADTLINPSYEDQKEADLDLVLSGDGKNIVMVEAGANIISEEVMGKCIDKAARELKELTDFQNSFISEAMANHGGFKHEFVSVTPEEKYQNYWLEFTSDLVQTMYAAGGKQYKDDLLNEYTSTHWSNLQSLEDLIGSGKIVSLSQLKSLVAKFTSHSVLVKIDSGDLYFDATIIQHQVNLLNDLSEVKSLKKTLRAGLTLAMKKIVKQEILNNERRVDGRRLDETRKILSLVDVLPRTHGSGLFQRGETQVLNVLTVGTKRDAQILDNMEDFEEGEKRYIHHYNFPSYSVGETGRYTGPGRREIGHGALAEKALIPVLPDEEDFPYTMRLVSECLGSNGSTSMASTCGSCLSLMSGGVPIKEMVAGVAMGLMLDTATGKFKVLTDIQGLEDHYGDMDFKVTGTPSGITAMQLDNKVAGLTPEILKLALSAAYKARMHILDIMKQTISTPKEEMSPYAPRVSMIQVAPDKIGDVIGPSGKTIKSIIAKTKTEIDIDDITGATYIYGRDASMVQKAEEIIEGLIKTFEVGDVVEGKVFRIEGFGAFVKIQDTEKEGMIHVSELEAGRTEKVEDVVNLEDVVKAKVVEVKSNGQIALSIKALLPDSQKKSPKKVSKKNKDKPDLSK